jgi:N6-adenosine-specific RNA methylase IME4
MPMPASGHPERDWRRARNCRLHRGARRPSTTRSSKSIVATTRDKIKSGGAILIDPVKAAAKTAEQNDRRAAHAARTINGGSIEDLGKMVREGRKFGSIGSDPQWKFLTRSAAGEGRSANIHYKTEEVDKIKNLPVGELLADDGAFYMWMVDWCPQDALDLLAHYGLQHITTAFTWIKTNGAGGSRHLGSVDLAHGAGLLDPGESGSLLARHQGRFKDQAETALCRRAPADRRTSDGALPQAGCLARSHRAADAEGDYLELQARRTRPGWVSWGDELEFTGVAA